MRSAGVSIAGLCFLMAMSANLIAGPYTERYRPQCHFSPREGWIGDPDGCIRYRNLYHLFWWGHAVSEDLVHWNELPWPMKGDDGSFDYYTGSVVVDERNTSGFGAETNSAMVAVYTAHERKGGRQTQRISYSTDYRNFHYYRKNPVLDIGSRSFRDPDVFWHESTEKWVMVVALPDQHTFRFFCSDNLREWRPLSDFGQIGSRDGLWEVPHLFEMQVEGEEGKTKWVLLCSVSPNRVQYFVGDFDGRKFTLDPAMAAELEPGPVPSGQVLFDFEATADGWKRTGSAFGARPVRGSLPKQQKVFGIEGRGYSSSYHGGDRATGTLTSPSFPITRDFINFKVAGGRGDDEMSVNLVVDGETVRSASGRNSETLLWRSWDVADLKGTQAQIRLVDRGTDDWGHIMADHFMISDAPVSSQRRDAFWLDYGPDFFAPRTFRNYDEEKMPVTLIGWMGNWEYANAVPTSWGRGAQSIPRELTLKHTGTSYALFQKPLPALQKLRGPGVEMPKATFDGALVPLDFKPEINVYELQVEFELSGSDQDVGLNLCASGSKRVSLGYDSAKGMLYLDRVSSGNDGFSDRFPKYVMTPFTPAGKQLKFHVFVDESSIEVFVNDGVAVLTSQVYPGDNGRGIQIFSRRGDVALKRFIGWELSSIWK